jgi:hypothetical protein
MLEVTGIIVWTTAVASGVRFRDIPDSPRRRGQWLTECVGTFACEDVRPCAGSLRISQIATAQEAKQNWDKNRGPAESGP